MLRRQGYEVLAAVDGQAALDLLAKPATHVDIVVADYDMPRLDGLALVRNLSRQRPGLAMVALTGREQEGLRDRFREAGAACLLTKPVGVAELLAALQQAAAESASVPLGLDTSDVDDLDDDEEEEATSLTHRRELG